MSSETNKQLVDQPANKPPVLDYARPELQAAPRGRTKYLGRIIALAVAMHLVLMFSGVSSDRVRIPLAKKVVLTLASAAITTLVIRATHGRAKGCAFLTIVFVLYTAMAVGVMWFWN